MGSRYLQSGGAAVSGFIGGIHFVPIRMICVIVLLFNKQKISLELEKLESELAMFAFRFKNSKVASL